MILVTGASGFLGQHLVRRLSAEQQTIRAIYHRSAPDNALRQLPGVTWVSCDLLDVCAVDDIFEDIEEVYHCAAFVSFETKHQEQIIPTNVNSTSHVVNAALARHVRKLVHVSSIASLGRGNPEKALTENDFWEESHNNTAYARSKYLSEMEVWRAMAEGLNAVIVNPAIILGAGNWEEGSARLIKVVDQEFPYYTDGANGWVDVSDVVTAMILLMRSAISEERFILCQGNYAYKEIFGLMAAALGKKAPHIKAPQWATALLWRWYALRQLLTGKTATVTRETTRTAQLRCSYDNSKLLRVLPDFQYTDIEQTIQQMAQAYRAKN